MRSIYLHGKLAEISPDPIRLEVETAGEAVRAIGTQIPRFLELLRDGSYQVVRGKDVDTGFHLSLEDVPAFRLGNGDLHIVPVIAGSKNGGMLKTILGVALIGAAFMFSGGALATPIAAAGISTGITYGNLAMVGLVMALSGVSKMLGSPDEKKEDKKDESFTLSGPGNTYEQGNPVPIVYGAVITGGVLISAGIDVEDTNKSRQGSQQDNEYSQREPESDVDDGYPQGPGR